VEQTIENFDGTKNITINEGGSMGDVQAGIEFIYHMREHLIDVGVATIYLFACYTLYLWLKRKFDGKTETR
jgi:hypothetical protein